MPRTRAEIEESMRWRWHSRGARMHTYYGSDSYGSVDEALDNIANRSSKFDMIVSTIGEFFLDIGQPPVWFHIIYNDWVTYLSWWVVTCGIGFLAYLIGVSSILILQVKDSLHEG